MTPAIVLAAGLGTRFPGANKLLADFGGRPLISHVVHQLQPASRPVIIVTGYQAVRVRRCLRQAFGHCADLRFVHNPQYRDGMAGSLKRGIGALAPRTSRAFLCLGDMPAIDARLLQHLDKVWNRELDFVRPVCRKRPGHPVLVSQRLFPAFAALTGDGGAKAVLVRVARERQKHLPWHDGCITDTDTPAAFRRAQRRCRQPGT